MQDQMDNQQELPTQPAPPERGRAWRIVAIVLTLHAALLGSVVLIQGCSKSDTTVKNDTTTTTTATPDATTTSPDASTQAQNTTVLPGSDSLTPEEHVAPLTPESTDPSLTGSTQPQGVAPISPQPEIRPEITPPAPTPAPAIASTEKKTPAPTKYVVKRGDTLAKIAKRNHLALADLTAANKLQKNAALKIGQKLILPAKNAPVLANAEKATATPDKTASASASSQKTHVVKKGESPTSIAKLYGISVETLMKANHITDPRKMKINQKLTIPVASMAAEVTPEAPAIEAPSAPATVSVPVIEPQESTLQPTAVEQPSPIVPENNKI